jgi:hypothetical protein
MSKMEQFEFQLPAASDVPRGRSGVGKSISA